jgi:transposase
MIQLEFRLEDRQALARERFEHPHPAVQRKREALWLKSLALPHGLIGQICDLSGNPLREYFRDYQPGGRTRLKEVRCDRPASALASAQTSVEEALRQPPPHSVKEAAACLAALTGVRRGLTQVCRWRHRLGLRYRQVGMIPAQADPQAQAQFLQAKLAPRLCQAQAGERRVLFVDAAHFVLGPVLSRVWSVVRVVRAPAGRQRFNVLGALDAITHELTMVCNDTYITARSVCELLRRVAPKAGAGPVTLGPDNALYQRCRGVAELAVQVGVELLFLPPYSPNLNLIERLWKFTKKECLAAQYYEHSAAFKGTIAGFLGTVHERHAEELQSLLTWNFRDCSTGMDADIDRVRQPSKSVGIRPFGIHFHASVEQYQHLLSNPEFSAVRKSFVYGRVKYDNMVNDEFIALDRGLRKHPAAVNSWRRLKAAPGADACAIHRRRGARVALLQSPILSAAGSRYPENEIFRNLPVDKPIYLYFVVSAAWLRFGRSGPKCELLSASVLGLTAKAVKRRMVAVIRCQ